MLFSLCSEVVFLIEIYDTFYVVFTCYVPASLKLVLHIVFLFTSCFAAKIFIYIAFIYLLLVHLASDKKVGILFCFFHCCH